MDPSWKNRRHEKAINLKQAGMLFMAVALLIDVGGLNKVAIPLSLIAFGMFVYGAYLESKEEKK